MEALQNSIEQTTHDVKLGTIEGGEEAAQKMLREIKATAPKDTGEYRNNWRIERDRGEDDEIYIVNDTRHGPYLVFPNSKMVGSPHADDPSQGIVHNVRGIVHKHRQSAHQAFVQKLKARIFG